MSKLVKSGAAILAGAIIINNAVNIFAKKYYCKQVKENSIRYEQEIEDYNQYVQDYADYINSLNLSDTEIIMKLMHDIWNEVGYAESDNLIQGYYRLSFQEEGKGVCTSFADDFTAKMNAINPEYDAKNIIVYADDAVVQIVDIERTVLEKIEEDEETKKNQEKYGNHMVSVIEIPNDNLYLIVDVTKLLIGVLKDGKIKILNTKDEDFMEYKVNVSRIYSLESNSVLKEEYRDTFNEPTISFEELEEKYGFEAQKEALESVEKIDSFEKKLVKVK